MFSGGIEMKHWSKMGEAKLNKILWSVFPTENYFIEQKWQGVIFSNQGITFHKFWHFHILYNSSRKKWTLAYYVYCNIQNNHQ